MGVSGDTAYDATFGMRAALADAVREPLPPPGGGQTPLRFSKLAELAQCDLELARLAEAHHDALAIAAELGAELASALYGVWAASGPDPLTATATKAGFDLLGTVPWCTGVNIVDRALVAAVSPEQAGRRVGLLFDLAVTDGTIVDDNAWKATAFARTGTGTVRFRLAVPAASLVGQANEYSQRAGFWHGAIGVSACWAGGLRGLLGRYQRQWKRTDPHSLAHLGSAVAWVDASAAVLERAARDIDTDPNDELQAEARARSVRHVVERICATAMDELAVGAGPEPLAFDSSIIGTTQQLQLYIRQCHGERDLEPLGRQTLLRI